MALGYYCNANRWWPVPWVGANVFPPPLFDFMCPAVPGTQQQPWVIAPHVRYRRKGVAADGQSCCRLSYPVHNFNGSIIWIVSQFFIDFGYSFHTILSCPPFFFVSPFWFVFAHERKNRAVKIDNPFIFRFSYLGRDWVSVQVTVTSPE